MANKQYAQLYIHDPDEALDICSHQNPECQCQVMSKLQNMLHNVNPFVPIYQQAYQIMSYKPPEEQHDVTLCLHLNDSADGHYYNLSTANKIAAIVPGHGEEAISSDHDIVLQLVGGYLKCISHMNPTYHPLHCVLLFSRGEPGWHKHLPFQAGANEQIHSKGGTISQTCYYAYQLHQHCK